MLDWWFTDYGAIIFFVTTILVAALVLFDALNRRVSALGWKLGVILPPLLILPSIFLKFSYVNSEGASGPAEPVEWMFLAIGAIAALVGVIVAIGYFMIVAARPSRPVAFPGGPAFAPAGPAGFPPPSAGPAPAAPTRGVGSAMPPARPARPQANGRVIQRNSPIGPREFPLYQGRTTVGRAATNDVMIDDPDVSREHAVIVEQGGRFVVMDVGSTHGTTVNGRPLRGQAYLADGDEIGLGPTVLLLFKTW